MVFRHLINHNRLQRMTYLTNCIYQHLFSLRAGYSSLASAQAVLRFLSAHLLPQPKDPFDIPELHLRPVATPRAPVSPDPTPAVSPLVIPPSPETSLPSPATPGSVSVAQVYTPVRLSLLCAVKFQQLNLILILSCRHLLACVLASPELS